jgi:hypothetical protein
VTMRQHMLDKCPVSGWPEVAQIISEDLGQPPEALFRDFSHTPIASASLAQVTVSSCCAVVADAVGLWCACFNAWAKGARQMHNHNLSYAWACRSLSAVCAWLV